jgi:hypothetical protein
MSSLEPPLEVSTYTVSLGPGTAENAESSELEPDMSLKVLRVPALSSQNLRYIEPFEVWNIQSMSPAVVKGINCTADTYVPLFPESHDDALLQEETSSTLTELYFAKLVGLVPV